jgi:predicted metal-dependent HD superfamily phosphohydrolase
VGAPGALIDTARQLILVTRHSSNADYTPTESLMVDIDLSILGALPERYDRYESSIRQEYLWIEESHYRQARKSILSTFHARTPIYATTEIMERFEDLAHINLSRAIAALRAKD